jgi:hypothetical protein
MFRDVVRRERIDGLKGPSASERHQYSGGSPRNSGRPTGPSHQIDISSPRHFRAKHISARAYLSEKNETTEGLDTAAVDKIRLGLGGARLVVGHQDAGVVVLGLAVERSLNRRRRSEDSSESCNRGLHLVGYEVSMPIVRLGREKVIWTVEVEDWTVISREKIRMRRGSYAYL